MGFLSSLTLTFTPSPPFSFFFAFLIFFFFFSKWGWRLLLSLSRARRFGLSLLKRFRTEGNGGSNWLCYIHSGAGFFFVGQEESFKAFFFFFNYFWGGTLIWQVALALGVDNHPSPICEGEKEEGISNKEISAGIVEAIEDR